MQSSVRTERNGAGIRRAYICSMSWLPRDLDVDEVAQLRREGREDLVEATRSEPGAPVVRAQLLAGARIDAVVQRQLQHLHQVEVAGEDVGLLAEGPDLDAAAAPAGPGVFERLALAELLLDHGVGVEDRREAVALADDAQGVLQQGVGRLARELQVAAGLQQVHLVDDVQQQVRQLVRAVRAVGQQARRG